MLDVVIIGQAPGPNADPDQRPFEGTNQTARRFLDLTGYASYEALRRDVFVFNLIHEYPGSNGNGDAFLREHAKARASALHHELCWGFNHVLMMGRHVGDAFGFKDLNWLIPIDVEAADWHATWHLIPHPSPVSRYWNDERQAQAARDYVRHTITIAEPLPKQLASVLGTD